MGPCMTSVQQGIQRSVSAQAVCAAGLVRNTAMFAALHMAIMASILLKAVYHHSQLAGKPHRLPDPIQRLGGTAVMPAGAALGKMFNERL